MEAVTEHFAGSGFKVFARMIEADPKTEVWAIPAKHKSLNEVGGTGAAGHSATA